MKKTKDKKGMKTQKPVTMRTKSLPNPQSLTIIKNRHQCTI